MYENRKPYGTSGEHALNEPEVRALLSKINHYEDKTLLVLAITTGIRREDIVKIELHGIDFEKGEVKYWEAKKKRPWVVPIGSETKVTLESHVRTLPKGTRWLFPNRCHPKNHISGRTAYNIFQRWLVIAGLEHRPFHTLRATCIKLCQKRGWTPEQVSALTGDSIRTIQEHYVTPTNQEMIEVATTKPIL
jgi:integrase